MYGEGIDMMQKPPLGSILENVKHLRIHATDAEKRLWRHLRNRQLDKLKFRRQHAIPPYIVDFYCEEKKLVIELDGGQHSEETDKDRTAFLESRSLKVLRFWNNDVLTNTEGVLTMIQEKVS